MVRILTIIRYPLIAAVTLVTVAMTAVGCSNDDIVEQPSAVPAIMFNPVVDHARSSRSVTPTTDDNFNAFDVWAFKADDDRADDLTFVMGHDAETGYLITLGSPNGLEERITGGFANIWGYDNPLEVTLWPNDMTQQLQFYAVAPSTVSEDADGLTLDITKPSHQFTYTPGEATNDDGTTDHSMQRDIVVAAKTVHLTDINHLGGYTVGVASDEKKYPQMTVPLTFRHALSQLSFQAKLEPGVGDFSVTIHSITVCNVHRTGICTIEADGTPKWTYPADDDEPLGSYTVTVNGTEGITLYSADGASTGAVTTPVKLSNGTEAGFDDNLMLVPQTLTPWDPTAAAAASQEGAYLRIKCEITQGRASLLAEPYAYVPLKGFDADSQAWDGQWAAGKHYVYTLTFGLGWNSEGQLNGSKITYSVTANNDWQASDTNNQTIGL